MDIDITDSCAPRKGDRITYSGSDYGLVTHVDGNLCWSLHPGDEKAQPFIWRFRDGLNSLHDWPGKDKTLECPR